MADPKYASLPGIDDSEKDVYESGDLPEDDQSWAPDELASETVQKEDVNTKAAFQKFNSKYVSGTDADFSGKIGSNAGYDTGDFMIAGEGEVETPTQKLQRLKIELSQLSENVKSADSAKSTALPSDLISQIELLQQQLASQGKSDSTQGSGTFARILTTLNEILTSQKHSASPKAQSQKSPASYNLLITPDQAQQKYATKLSSIEQRIANIEKTIGTDTAQLSVLSAQTKYKTLRASVEALEAKRNLLDPEVLPQVDTRLQAVLNKLNEINKARKQKGAEQAAIDKKIVELYEMVQKWDSVFTSLPSVVQRLETLNELHQQAAEFSSTITHMESVQNQISSKLTDTASLSKQVEAVFKENAATIQANLQSLEARIQKLGIK